MSAAPAWDGLLRAVGLPASRSSRLIASAAILAAIVAWVAVRVALQGTGLDLIVVHVLLWIAWLVWLAKLRPNSSGATPPREVFLVRVLPGAALAFAQFTGPIVDGVTRAPRIQSAWVAVPAALTIAAGLGMFATGARALGVTRLAFVQEFGGEPLRLETTGLYGRVRHPCFAGAVLASVGAAALLGGTALGLAAANVAVLPLYVRFEDARLVAAHGAAYAEYAARVPSIVPRLFSSRDERRRVHGRERRSSAAS